MPIETNSALQPFPQSDFGAVAYEVVGEAITVHKRLGRIFDEWVYRKTLAHILGPRAADEVRIRLTHQGFEKQYFLDLVVDAGCPFELKVVSQLHDRHRGQLIQYLMLTGLNHGKLINFGGEVLEHEFVNCHETTGHRRAFELDLSRWPAKCAEARRFQEIAVNLLRDWGTGLDRSLYIDATVHFLGGPEVVRQPVETFWEGARVGWQLANLVGHNAAFEITCLRDDMGSYEQHLRRLLGNTTLGTIFWANVASGRVRLVELAK